MYEYFIKKSDLVKSLKSSFDLRTYCMSLNRSALIYSSKTDLQRQLNHTDRNTFKKYYENSFQIFTSKEDMIEECRYSPELNKEWIQFSSKKPITFEVLTDIGISFAYEQNAIEIINRFKTMNRLHHKKNLYNFSKKFMSFILENNIDVNLSNKKLQQIFGFKSDEGIRKKFLGKRTPQFKILGFANDTLLTKFPINPARHIRKNGYLYQQISSSLKIKYKQYFNSEVIWFMNQITKLDNFEDNFYSKYEKSNIVSLTKFISQGKTFKNVILKQEKKIDCYYNSKDDLIAVKTYSKCKVYDKLSKKDKWKDYKVKVEIFDSIDFSDEIFIKKKDLIGKNFGVTRQEKIATKGDKSSLKYLFYKQKLVNV